MNIAVDNTASSTATQEIEVFSFWVEQNLFAIRVSSVLSICQDDAQITKLPSQRVGLLGMIKYLDQVVPVYDFAKCVGIQSGANAYEEQADHLSEFCKQHERLLEEPDHVEQLLSCYKELRTWLGEFHMHNEVLVELFTEVKTVIGTAIADSALIEDIQECRRIGRVILQCSDQLREVAHSVLLYLTLDGNGPAVALRIDEVNNITAYSQSEFTDSSNVLTGPQAELAELVEGFLCRDGLPNSLLLRAESLIEIPESLAHREV